MRGVDATSESTAVTDTSNAKVEAGDGRTTVTIMASASGGAMTVTVEVSEDDSNWYEDTSVFSSDVTDGNSESEHLTTGARYVRASGSANVGRVEVAAKGA